MIARAGFGRKSTHAPLSAQGDPGEGSDPGRSMHPHTAALSSKQSCVAPFLPILSIQVLSLMKYLNIHGPQSSATHRVTDRPSEPTRDPSWVAMTFPVPSHGSWDVAPSNRSRSIQAMLGPSSL